MITLAFALVAYVRAFLVSRGANQRSSYERCRYRGAEGMKRWVGLGVIADNLINVGMHWRVARA